MSNGIPCMQNLKGNDVMQINLLQNRNGLREQTGCWRRRMRGRDSEFGMDMYTRLSLKWITNKDLLYSTWDSMLYGSLDRRGVSGRMDTCICMAKST